jgi:hypothetical protein
MPDAASTNAVSLLELLADQETRWNAGKCVLVETYLQQQPALKDHPQAVLDLVYHEIVLRESRGELPKLAEYQARFPQLAAELRIQFDLDEALRARSPTRCSPTARPILVASQRLLRPLPGA